MQTNNIDRTADALHDAVLRVANTVLEHEDLFRDLRDSSRPGTDTREACDEILTALKNWNAASNAAVAAVVRR